MLPYSESFTVHNDLLSVWAMVFTPPETPKERLVRMLFETNGIILTPDLIRLLAANWGLFSTAIGALLSKFGN
jgi:hypothetical protein